MNRQVPEIISRQSLDARGRGVVWSILLTRRQLRALPPGHFLEVAYDDPCLPCELAKILDRQGYLITAVQHCAQFNLLQIRRTPGATNSMKEMAQGCPGCRATEPTTHGGGAKAAEKEEYQ